MIMTAIITAIVVIGIFAFLNKRAFGKVFHYGKTQAGNVGRFAEATDPVNQMRESAEEAKEQISTARNALIKNKALKESLERQVEKNKRDIATLESRIKHDLEHGKPKTDAAIITKAEQLAVARHDFNLNTQQLQTQIEVYNNTLTSAKKAASKIGELENRADRLQVRIDTSAAQADLAEMLSQYNPSGISNAIGKASKFEEIAERQISENQARLQVNADLGLTDFNNEEDINVSAEASNILDELEPKSPVQDDLEMKVMTPLDHQ